MVDILNWGGAYLATPLDFTRALLLVALVLTFVKSLLLRRWYVAACLLPLVLYWLDLTLLETVPWTHQLTWIRVGVNVGYAGIVARVYVDINRADAFRIEMKEKDQETTRLRDSLNRRKRAGPDGADLPKTTHG